MEGLNNIPTVSIIMAAYNAEATVGKMVEAILAQTFSDWELVAVDDGSTDGTGTILDGFSNRDSRIRVIHKANGGVAAARQTGIDNARGEYTIHADADDWVEPDMLAELVATARDNDADIVICNYYTDAPGEPSREVAQRPDSLDCIEVLYGLYAKGLFGGLCHKLIKKSVYDKEHIRFEPGVNYCEDMLILTRMLLSGNLNIAYHDGAYYHYVVNPSSLTGNVSLSGFNSVKRFHQIVSNIFPDEPRFAKVVDAFALNEFIVMFTNKLYANTGELKREYKKVKVSAMSDACPRWRFGYKCIEWGMIGLAHKLIRF